MSLSFHTQTAYHPIITLPKMSLDPITHFTLSNRESLETSRSSPGGAHKQVELFQFSQPPYNYRWLVMVIH